MKKTKNKKTNHLQSRSLCLPVGAKVHWLNERIHNFKSKVGSFPAIAKSPQLQAAKVHVP